MTKPSLGKILLLTGGISALASGAAAAENANSLTPQYNGVIVGTGVRNIPRKPFSSEELFGFPSDKRVKVVAMDAIHAANKYNGYLLTNPGAKRIDPALWNEMVPGAQNILQEVEKKEVKQGTEFNYPKAINQINGYISDGEMSAEELNKLPKYEITFALAQEGGHNAMTFVNLLPKESGIEKPALSRDQLDFITQTAKKTAEQTLNTYLEHQKEQEKLGHATGPAARQPGQSNDLIYTIRELEQMELMRNYNGGNSNMPQRVLNKKIARMNDAEEQIPKYEKPKRQTKREKQRARFLAGINYSSDQNTVSANFGARFGDFSDPINGSIYFGLGKGISDNSVTETTKTSPIGLYGVGKKNESDFMLYSAGAEIYLGEGDLKVTIGGGAGISTWTTTQTAEIYRKNPSGDVLLNSNAEIAHKVAMNYLGSLGFSYKGIEGDFEMGYSGRTKDIYLGASAKVAFPFSSKKTVSPDSKHKNRK